MPALFRPLTSPYPILTNLNSNATIQRSRRPRCVTNPPSPAPIIKSASGQVIIFNALRPDELSDAESCSASNLCAMSDIRVSVQWKNSTVFAGERIECKIIFTNVAQAPGKHRSPSPSSQFPTHTSARDRWKETLPIQRTPQDSFVSSSPSLSVSRTKLRTHGPAASLSGPSHIKTASSAGGAAISNGTQASKHSHRRSVSIISLAGDVSQGKDVPNAQIDCSKRPGRGHTRAASLQVLPRRTGDMASGPFSGKAPSTYFLYHISDLIAPANGRATTMPSPLLRSPTFSAEPGAGSGSDAENYLRTQRSSASGSAMSRHSRQDSETLSNFKFPRIHPTINELSAQRSNRNPPHISGDATTTLFPGPFGPANAQDLVNPVTRILSPASMNGTPRSSGDFYSLSNNSTETLASEYITQDMSRLPLRASHDRLVPLQASLRSDKPPEVLMMGYGQVIGSYTLDGSLVDQAPFEDVKRKGIIGGQGGGGVVRSDSVKRENGFFGALGWGNIGDSLGGLLGGNELSTIKEEKGSDRTKSIPILSTPQAILFVNLQLGPGESKTYLYSHPLPRGIPPTHKGRALKVSYSLVVGVQRAAKAAQQHHLRHVNVPFRVLPSVNSKRSLGPEPTILTEVRSRRGTGLRSDVTPCYAPQ